MMYYRFVTCPPDLMEDVRGPPRKLPRIFIEEEDGLKEFFLVVYQVGHSDLNPPPSHRQTTAVFELNILNLPPPPPPPYDSCYVFCE